MGMTSLSLITSVWLLNLFHQPDNKPVPSWAKTLILDCVARCVCMTTCITSDRTICNDKSVKRPQHKIWQNQGSSMISRRIGGGQPDYVEIYRMRQAQTRHQAYAQQQDITSLPEEHHQEDWHNMARILDRLFLYIYVIIIVIVSIVCTGAIIQWQIP